MTEEVKEDFEITVKQTEDEHKEQDIKLSLAILDSNSAMAITEAVNGKIEAMILRSNKPVHIKMWLLEFPDIVIYEDMQYYGCFYLPLRISPISKTAKVFNFAPQHFLLRGEQIGIELKGQSGTNVDILIRVCD